jgi:hypothetical protein
MCPALGEQLGAGSVLPRSHPRRSSYVRTDPGTVVLITFPFLAQALEDAIAATRELEARALKAKARQHLQQRLRSGATTALASAPCAHDDAPCRVTDRLFVGARLQHDRDRLWLSVPRRYSKAIVPPR